MTRSLACEEAGHRLSRNLIPNFWHFFLFHWFPLLRYEQLIFSLLLPNIYIKKRLLLLYVWIIVGSRRQQQESIYQIDGALLPLAFSTNLTPFAATPNKPFILSGISEKKENIHLRDEGGQLLRNIRSREIPSKSILWMARSPGEERLVKPPYMAHLEAYKVPIENFSRFLNTLYRVNSCHPVSVIRTGRLCTEIFMSPRLAVANLSGEEKSRRS